MASVAQPVREAKPNAAPAPKVKPRHGKCNLRLTINEDIYTIRKHQSGSHARMWALKKLSGARSGRTLLVGSVYAQQECQCEDWQQRRPPGGCKHLRALRALGLLPKKQRRSRSEYRTAEAPAPSVLPLPAAKGGVECPF